MNDNSVSGHDRTEPDDSDYSLTIEEASALFAEAGVPRNPRSIRRFCQHKELDCITIETPTSSRYLISRSSLEKLIVEKQQALRFRDQHADTSGHDRPQPVTTGYDRTEPDTPQTDLRTDDDRDLIIKRLEDEIMHLRIDNRAKEHVITILRDDRREMVAQIESANYRLGAAENRLALLDGPKARVLEPENAASAAAEETATTVIPLETVPVQPAPTLPTPEAPRSFFGRFRQ